MATAPLRPGGAASRLAALLLVGAAACAPAADAPAPHVIEGATMGTTFAVRVVGDELGERRVAALQVAVEGLLERIDGRLSTWRPDSELSRFNRLESLEPFAVSADMVTVLRHAREVSARTAGAFDVTVAPLVDAWGFGPAGRPPAFPDGAEVEALRARVDYRLLDIDAAASTIRKRHPLLAVDLSALAKGYAVDQVAELLRAERIESFLVEIGGELRARGRSARGDPWRVGIERPAPGPPAVAQQFGLRDLALATSGDYRNYYEVDGRRLSHTIDPRTGRPVTHGLASASVLDPLCVRADALATALEVLGPEEGFARAVEHGWAALLVERRPDGTLRERETPAFAALAAPS